MAMRDPGLNSAEIISKMAQAEYLAREAAGDCKLYIRKYVYIEDPDSPGAITRLILWPLQENVLDIFLNKKLSIVLKARQLGLSWLALAYASHRLVFRPGYTAIALSKREEEAKELVRRMTTILRKLPPWMIREKKRAARNFSGPTWDATTTSVTIYHPDGLASTFESFTSSPDSARSFTANLVIIDEWAFQMWAREIWAAAFPTINRPTGGQVIGISTAKIGTFFEEMWNLAAKGLNAFTPVFLPWWTDPRRDSVWYADTKAALPHSYLQEYPATPEEAFSVGEMTAFPEFDRDVHVCDPFPVPAHWRRWMAVDNGYDDPFDWLWFAVDEGGTVYVYREFTRSPGDEKLLYTEQAQQVAGLSSYVVWEHGQEETRQEPRDFIVAGLDAWATHHRDQSGKDLIAYYQMGGLYGFIKAITDRRLRKSTVHEYLKALPDPQTGRMKPKLQIFSTCRTLIDILPRLPKDEKDPEKVADCAIDHGFDSLGYGLIAYHVGQTAPPKEDVPVIRRHKDTLAKRQRRRR